MKRIIFLSLGLAALIIFARSNTFACGCVMIGNPTVEQRVKNKASQSKFVFSGEVVEVKANANGHGFTTTFKAEQFWKGTPAEKITLTGDGSSCEYDFKVGKNYLVYAYIREDVLTTNECIGNLEIKNASEELKVLGKGKKPGKDNL